jgi:predicted enzyme related to lactoylglutathione lyase
VKAKALSWAGVKTNRYDEMKSFLSQQVGLKLDHEDGGIAAFQFPNGDTFEVFGPDDGEHDHFTTGPVVEFEVDDVDSARDDLERAGLEFFGSTESAGGFTWAHFRGPDGNVYGITKSLS